VDNLLINQNPAKSYQEIWDVITGCLRNHLSESGYQTFISSATPRTYFPPVLTLDVPNMFSRNWIKENCESILRYHFHENGLDAVIIDYSVVPGDGAEAQLNIFATPSHSEKSSIGPKTVDLFNPKYTFDNFIVGHNNRFAHAASEAVSKAPAKAYNPLFIYGSVGLGKTHLLHAIGNRISQLFVGSVLKLVSSEKFTNDMINAIKDKQINSFREKYRQCDVLMIDDIQFLAGKEQTQEEFFHTFNELHGRNRQIIITSDRPPKEIPTLEDRLRTRFEWGLIADIQPPEFETRIAILRKKTELNQLVISDEILHFIATQIPTNVREMEGALTRIVAYASLLNTEVTLSIASNVIQDIIGIRQETPISISLIKRKVCDYFQISDVELCSKNRTKELAYARQIGMYLARELTNVSLPKIGENFGKRDHSTVMHACDKIKVMMASDSATKSIIQVLLSNIRNDE
jgi:chromosomal replication initiator protein